MKGLQKILLHRLAKPILIFVLSLPAAWQFFQALNDALGANPAEALLRGSGIWTLRWLCLVLLITPLRQMVPSLAVLQRFRRILGLTAFAYALLHLVYYTGFDFGFALTEILADIGKRPFVLVGFIAFVGLLPLALTSSNRAIRRLTLPHWQRLHTLVYLIVPLGVLHFLWIRAGKNNFLEVSVYAAIVALLLAWRLYRRLARR